jgi:hypothetical protein
LLALGEHSEARTKLEAGAHLLRTTRVASYLGGALADSIDLYLALNEPAAALHAANEILELSKAGTVFAEPGRATASDDRSRCNARCARPGLPRSGRVRQPPMAPSLAQRRRRPRVALFRSEKAD